MKVFALTIGFLMLLVDGAAVRGQRPDAGLKAMAVERGIPVLQPQSINTTKGVAELRALQPELLVVAAYGQILSRDVLAVAPAGGINVHASLLPKYRGAAPVVDMHHRDGEQDSGERVQDGNTLDKVLDFSS